MRDLRLPGEVANKDINPYANIAVTALKNRDSSRYMKFSEDVVALAFSMTPSEARVFLLVINEVMVSGYNRDQIQLTQSVKDAYCAKIDSVMADKTFDRGRAGLCKKNVLHKAQRNGWYWVSPDVAYCGNIRSLIERYEKIEAKDLVQDD